jgi:hypothetical protein
MNRSLHAASVDPFHSNLTYTVVTFFILITCFPHIILLNLFYLLNQEYVEIIDVSLRHILSVN